MVLAYKAWFGAFRRLALGEAEDVGAGAPGDLRVPHHPGPAAACRWHQKAAARGGAALPRGLRDWALEVVFEDTLVSLGSKGTQARICRETHTHTHTHHTQHTHTHTHASPGWKNHQWHPFGYIIMLVDLVALCDL